MKKILVTVLVLALGLALSGCGGSNNSNNASNANNTSQNSSAATGTTSTLDKTFAMANGSITFGISSSWAQSDGVQDNTMQEYLFQTDGGTFSIIYSPTGAQDPYVAIVSTQKLYEDSFRVTNFKELSRNETTRDGMTIVVFEYSYNDPDDGDTIERLAFITKGDAQVVIYYLNYADWFNPTYFDELLNSLTWK